MDRSIKFRAWHIPTQQMVYNIIIANGAIYHFTESGNSSMIGKNRYGDYKSTPYNHYKRSDCVLMQYSGVKDIRCRKIWEGDILYWTADDHDEGYRIKRYEPVIFRHGTFGVDTSWDRFEKTVALCRDGRVFDTGRVGDQIVGNIYQNAELLKLHGCYDLVTGERLPDLFDPKPVAA